MLSLQVSTFDASLLNLRFAARSRWDFFYNFASFAGDISLSEELYADTCNVSKVALEQDINVFLSCANKIIPQAYMIHIRESNSNLRFGSQTENLSNVE